MTDKDIELIRKAIDWVDAHPFSGSETTCDDDEKVNRDLIVAFCAGAEYAENNP